jgi:hypothetical protein
VHGRQHIGVLAHPQIVVAAPHGHATGLAVRTVPKGFWEFARYSLQLDERPISAVCLHIGYKLRKPLTEIHSTGHSRGYPCIEAKLLIDIWAP